MRPLGGLDGDQLGDLVQPVHDFFGLARCQRVQQGASSGGYWEEDAPQGEAPESSTCLRMRGNSCTLSAVTVVLICSLSPVSHQRHRLLGGVEHARGLPEGVVGGGACAVQRDRDRFRAGLAHRGERGAG